MPHHPIWCTHLNLAQDNIPVLSRPLNLVSTSPPLLEICQSHRRLELCAPSPQSAHRPPSQPETSEPAVTTMPLSFHFVSRSSITVLETCEPAVHHYTATFHASRSSIIALETFEPAVHHDTATSPLHFRSSITVLKISEPAVTTMPLPSTSSPDYQPFLETSQPAVHHHAAITPLRLRIINHCSRDIRACGSPSRRHQSTSSPYHQPFLETSDPAVHHHTATGPPPCSPTMVTWPDTLWSCRC